MLHVKTIDDREPMIWSQDAEMIEAIERATQSPVATFQADNERFRIFNYRQEPLKGVKPWENSDDYAALKAGFEERLTFVAADERNVVWAVFELFAGPGLKPLERGLQVDANRCARGIGKAFAREMKELYDFQLSGKQTDAGAKLLNSLSRDGVV